MEAGSRRTSRARQPYDTCDICRTPDDDEAGGVIRLFPSEFEAARRNPCLEVDMLAARELRIQTARFLRQARRRDPARYREVAARHPVLSTWQVDRRRAVEVELREAEEDEQGGHRPGTLDAQIHRDWLETAFQEAA
jgi:hypothetical protein